MNKNDIRGIVRWSDVWRHVEILKFAIMKCSMSSSLFLALQLLKIGLVSFFPLCQL